MGGHFWSSLRGGGEAVRRRCGGERERNVRLGIGGENVARSGGRCCAALLVVWWGRRVMVGGGRACQAGFDLGWGGRLRGHAAAALRTVA